MEKLQFNRDSQGLLAPRRGFLLQAHYRLAAGQEFDSVLCQYGVVANGSVELFGCRSKTFLINSAVPCDYGRFIGNITLPLAQMIEIFQVAAPPWFYRVPPDALFLAATSRRLAGRLGLHDLFAPLLQ